MRLKIYLLAGVFVSACTVVDSSGFDYLDDESLKLHPLLIIGAEQDVEISLPSNLLTRLPNTLFMQSDGLKLPYTKALDIPFEWQWSGSNDPDDRLYLFELAFSFTAGRRLLSESVAARVEQEKNPYAGFEADPWHDYVLKKTQVSAYQSAQGYQWVMKKLPLAEREHESFSLPISDQHQLLVWFWYNTEWLDAHPGWFERRQALSRRILDSVRLIERA